MSVNEKMTAIANAIREKTGDTESLTLDGMATEVPKVYDAGYAKAVDKYCPAFEESGAVVTAVPLKEYPTDIISHVSGASGVTLQHGRQLFDKTDVDWHYAYIRSGYSTNDNIWNRSADSFTIRLPCKPNTTYSAFHKNASDSIFRLACVEVDTVPVDKNGSATNVPLFNVAKATTGDLLTITTTENAKYLIVQISLPQKDTTFQTLVVTDGITEHHVDFGKAVDGSYNWTSGVLTDANGNTTQLAPKTIDMVDGMNFFTSDTGNTTVSGRIDPVAMLEDLTDTILRMGVDI